MPVAIRGMTTCQSILTTCSLRMVCAGVRAIAHTIFRFKLKARSQAQTVLRLQEAGRLAVTPKGV